MNRLLLVLVVILACSSPTEPDTPEDDTGEWERVEVTCTIREVQDPRGAYQGTCTEPADSIH